LQPNDARKLRRRRSRVVAAVFLSGRALAAAEIVVAVVLFPVGSSGPIHPL